MSSRKKNTSPLRNFIAEKKTQLDLEIEQSVDKVRAKYRRWEPFFIGSFSLHFLATFFLAVVPRWIMPQYVSSVLSYATIASLYFLVKWAGRVPAGAARKRAYSCALCCVISLIFPGYMGSAFRSSELKTGVEVMGQISKSESYQYRLRYGEEQTRYNVFVKFSIRDRQISGFCGGCPTQSVGMPVILRVSKSFPRIFEGEAEKTFELWKRNKEKEVADE